MRYVFKELRRHSLRSFFSITGYAIAAVFMFVILSITGTNKKESFGILQSTGTHFIAYIPTDISCCTSEYADGTVFAEGVKTMMLSRNVLNTVEQLEGVRDAAPCLLYKMYHNKFQGYLSIAGLDTTSVATVSNACARTNLIAGKFLSALPDELVAEQAFADANNISVGDTLEVFGTRIKLAGIVNTGIKPVKADFYAPIDLVRNLLSDKLRCIAPNFDMNVILVEVADARLQDNVIRNLRNTAGQFAISTYNCYEPAYKVMDIIDKSSLGLTAIILVFLVLFSAKTQITSLIERFREIGILKSLGWTDFDLSLQVLLTSFVQSVAGVTIGLLAGAAAIFLINHYESGILRFVQLNFEYANIPRVYGLSLAGALLASILPMIRIFRIRSGEIINKYM